MRADGGGVRPHYRALIEALGALSAEERERRLGSAAQYLREAGVFYRAGGEGGERQWPLAVPPLILSPEEWRGLERDLKARAGFLEALLADLYGARRLIREGVLPGRLVGANPEFLRPLANQASGGRPLLGFLAIDLRRDAAGRWWAVADRTQAPSGAGFALENRVATARALPDLAKAHRLRRLAGFFTRFRETLDALGGRPEGGGRPGLLTPGPSNETYFEHSYLARYLGLQLLEGGDLAVHGDEARVRTVEGLRPVSVLWRRLDADWTDPLELKSRSRLGTPGLVRAVRAGNLHLVNALGSGLAETPAFAAFEEAMAVALLGEPLALASPETLWLGEPAARERAREAGWRTVEGFPGRAEAAVEAAAGERWSELAARRAPAASTTPVLEGGRLVPRAVTLRVFLARGPGGWEVMPGGFARAAPGAGSDVEAIAAGGRSLDVWIAAEGEERPVTLLGPPADGFQRRLPGSLPSRAADNLFWLGRSVERLEAAVRLWRAALAADAPSGKLAETRAALLVRSGVAQAGEDAALGLRQLARGAYDIASRIRDRFSPDGWRVLHEIVEVLDEAVAGPGGRDDDVLADRLLTRLAGFSGLVGENMVRLSGWRFLQCGRRLERGLLAAEIGAAFLAVEDEGVLDALLDYADSRMTYRRRFSVELSAPSVLDLVALDPLNPRSVAYQVEALRELLAQMPGNRPGESLDPPSRRAARLKVRLETALPGEVNAAWLGRVARDLADISDLLTERFFAAEPEGATERWDAE